MRYHASAMRRARAHVRSGVARRLADLERRTPGWRAWLALLGEVSAEIALWTDRITMDHAPDAGGSASAAPFLDGCTVRLDHRALTKLLTTLGRTAGRHAPAEAAAHALARYQPDPETARTLVEAAICHDDAAIAEAAGIEGVEPAALATVVRLAALPLLAACASGLAHRIPEHGSRGYCPLCGSWPLLAELRGVERERVLRCGQCGTAWRAQWLRCVYCGEARHDELGALATADGLESRKAETCASCRSYLKTVAVLTPLGLVELWMTDLETVELDLAARERGYGRPSESGRRIRCRVVLA